MKVILEKIIKNKLAQLVLCDDNITVNVVYDGEVIDSSGGGTWENIKDELWFQEFILSDTVSEYLMEKDSTLQEMLLELD